MNYSRCSICNEQGHNLSNCPDLCEPLKPGFHGGGSGGGGHGGDDDESVKQILCLNLGLMPSVFVALEFSQSPATTLEHSLGADSDGPLLLGGATARLNRFANLLDTSTKTLTL